MKTVLFLASFLLILFEPHYLYASADIKDTDAAIERLTCRAINDGREQDGTVSRIIRDFEPLKTRSVPARFGGLSGFEEAMRKKYSLTGGLLSAKCPAFFSMKNFRRYERAAKGTLMFWLSLAAATFIYGNVFPVFSSILSGKVIDPKETWKPRVGIIDALIWPYWIVHAIVIVPFQWIKMRVSRSPSKF